MMGLLVASANACPDDGACLLIGCEGGFAWDGEAMSGRLPPGDYVLEINVEGSLYRAECTVSEPGGPSSECGLVDGPTTPGDQQLYGPHLSGSPESFPDGFGFLVNNGEFGPSSVSVAVTHDGNPIGSWDYPDLTYEKFYDSQICEYCYPLHRFQEQW